ncbi:MAG: pyruvate ferredoxin oxidoreductase [Candidatus Diapherotrites archaeon]
MKELIDGNEACVYAVKLCRVQCVPAYPITPQTELVEKIAQWNAEGKLDVYFNQMDSEHSVLSAALGAEMTGNRTFTSTSCQGLLLMYEILPIVSGTRMPIVMVNGSRAISAPISLWPDHNDFLSCRDHGWIMLAAENNQELLDFIPIAYRTSEHKGVLLPSLVEMDGFILSSTREPVEIPSQEKVDKFLPPLHLEVKLDVDHPKSLGVPVLEAYWVFRERQHQAMHAAARVLDESFKEWAKLTGRKYSEVEEYFSKDAQAVLVMMGANTTIAKAACRNLRKKGKKVGIAKLRVIRPFPEKQLRGALKKAKKVGVFDQNISLGSGGILYAEVKSALSEEGKKVSGFVGGLGGRMLSEKDFEQVFLDLLEGKNGKKWLV